jgi:hypothetical protein
VPDGWLAEATTARVGIGQPGRGYGYQWWTYDDGSFAARGIFWPGHLHRPQAQAGDRLQRQLGRRRPRRCGRSDAREAFYKAVQKAVDDEQAKGRQIDLDQPFAFRITGSYSHLIWHVVTGGKPAGAAAHGAQGHGGHGGHANQQAGMKVFRSPQAEGQLVGIYSGARLEGVVSHPGERFHIHFVDAALKVSGHVDQYRVKSGSTLWLAQP